MKRNMKKTLALCLCLILCIGLFSGCGKEEQESISRREPAAQERKEPRETEGSEIYSISAYYDNDELEVSLDFYSDFTVAMCDSEMYLEGTYYFEGEDFVMTLEDEIYEGYLAEEGVLSLFDVDGYFYEVEELGYYPRENAGGFVAGGSESNREYEDLGNGTIRYRDRGAGIAATYADWMTNYEDDVLPGSILIADNEEGFVLTFNVTDDYWSYDGYDEDFLMELYNDPITAAVNEIYGSDWEAGAVTFLEDSRESYVIIGEANLYNDDFDIMVRAELYHTLLNDEITDTIIAKIYLYEYGNDAQLRQLKDNVKKCTSR